MRKILLAMAIVCSTLGMHAQYQYRNNNQRQTIKKESNNSFNLSKLTFGGGLGLQFGDYTAINVAPQVGYNFSQYINAGAGLSYTYYREKYNHDNWKRTSSYLGFNVYARIYPVSFLVFSIQPEMNRMWQTDKFEHTGEKLKKEKFIPVCLIGGGVRLGPMTAMIQYDVAQNEYSPYGDNIFYSVGYTFSF